MQVLISKSKDDAEVKQADAPNVPEKEGKEGFWGRLEKAIGPEGKNWTQAELARKSGVRPSSITHWKTGESGPSASELARVAQAVGVSMDQLWGEKPMPNMAEDAGRLSKPESDLIILYRGNEKFRRIVRNLIEELGLNAEDP